MGSYGCSSWPSVAQASRPFTPIPLPRRLAATLEESWTKATPCPNTLQPRYVTSLFLDSLLCKMEMVVGSEYLW